jgi:hypothetical protein
VEIAQLVAMRAAIRAVMAVAVMEQAVMEQAVMEQAVMEQTVMQAGASSVSLSGFVF